MPSKKLAPESEVLTSQPAEMREVDYRSANIAGPNKPGSQRGFDSSQGRDDFKSPKRYRASQAEWSGIYEAFIDDRCWVCGDIWTELHHILNRSHSGDDVVVNLAPLCAECHRRVEARDSVARSLIRQALMPSNIAYLRYRLGDGAEAWLERHYALQVAA